MNKKLKIILISVCGAAAVYFGLCGFFRNHFSLFTYVNGVNISGSSVSGAERRIYDSGSDYVLKITGRGGVTDIITGDRIGLKQVPQVMLDGILGQQSAFAWPVALIDHTSVSVPVRADYSEEALQNAVAGLAFLKDENLRTPKDAVLKFEDGEYRASSNQGSYTTMERLYPAVEAAVTGMKRSLDLDEAGVYAAADVTEDDPWLNFMADALNEYKGIEITIPFGEEEQVLTLENLQSFVTFDDAGMILDDQKIAEYVDALAEKYDTKGKPHEFKTTSGTTVTLEAGSYGWEMNRTETAELLKAALAEGGRATVEPVFKQSARSFVNGDIGDTYVECDLDEQHVYVYVDGELKLDTDCVSGKAVNNSCTPNGVYAIYGKQRNAVLVGEGYRTPVSYWMPFYRNYGLHDANWRSSFGGKNYVNNGSHGCVNLPVSFAGELFETVEIGTPVIVHGGMTRNDALAYNNGGRMPDVIPPLQPEKKAAAAAPAPAPQQSVESAMAVVNAATAAAAQAQQVLDAAAAMVQADPTDAQAQATFAAAQAQLTQANANLYAANVAAVQAAQAAQAAQTQ